MENLFRTGLLIAALTALFMEVGYWIAGPQGMLVALIIASAMNLFTYWGADRIVLSMYGAREVDEMQAPGLLRCADPERGCRAQSGDGASVHRQSA